MLRWGGMTYLAETDENGDSFEVWVVKRSFAQLAPVCRMGVVVALLFVVIADPLYYFLDLWSKAISQVYLAAWHATIAIIFSGFLLVGRRVQSHAGRVRTLQAYFLAVTFLFIWFGVVSWIGTGDLSILAIAQLLVASVFNFPGHFRRWLYGLQALVLGALLAWLDGSGKFLGQMHFANLLVIAAVAYVIDGYMLRNARALFQEKCRVAAERRRADAVLYNALPLEIADELKAHHRVKAQSYPAMTVLFADLVGFTHYASGRAPDQVLDMLNEIFSEMDALVDTFQVEKIKTMGDAYMVVSKTRPDAVARLALAMLTLIERYSAERGVPLALRIGMHCGPTIAGVIGHKRFLYDVWGDAVNVASRMESSGVPGRVHMSEAMAEALETSFQREERGLVDIKGKGLLRTYFLLGEQAAA